MANKSSVEKKAEKASGRIGKGAEQFKESTSEAVERTHEALDTAADKVEQGMHSGTDKVADAAERTVDHAESAAERGREAFDDVVAHAGDWADKARDYVREKPTQSVVMALAAGWLVGRLMRR